MPRYSRSILQQHADELYEQADSLVWSRALATGFSFLVTGFLIGGAGVALDLADPVVGIGVGLVLGVVGFADGWSKGQREAFTLRLRAQEVLCQMMIERNTADLLRLSAAKTDPQFLSLDNATLQMLRPGKSMRTRMARLGR